MELVAKKGLQQYFLQLQHHPLRTKVPPFILSLCVFLIISALFLMEISGIHKLQFRRCAFYVEPFLTWLNQLFGFAYLEPFGHFLHIILDKMFEGKKDTKTVAKIAVLERLALSPWSNMLFMIYYCVIVEILSGCVVAMSTVCATAGSISKSASNVYGIDERLDMLKDVTSMSKVMSPLCHSHNIWLKRFLGSTGFLTI
ncbi:hypothetical protein P3X46_020601 [Hevea brasiliensis]|uniref:Uncharacterized protein n=1 Tax=Hevea brasiliensis TaxID=3981 RepID=A0ABQ9LMD1_HEVBR|nr:hypothetical protein P3X46_020601 [Hevea brasiliensis]